MKKNKMIGIALIICSLAVQVGYALDTDTVLTNTEEFDVEISSMQYRTSSRDISIDIANVKGTKVDVAVNNMYPGAQYDIGAEIKNKGKFDATITNIEIVPEPNQSVNSNRLFEAIVGFDAEGKELTTEAYELYLEEQYCNKSLKQNGVVEIQYQMGLSEALTDLENETVQYSINMTLEQSTGGSGSGGGSSAGGNTDDNSGDNSGNLENPDIEIEDDGVPAGPATGLEQGDLIIEDEEVPAGAVQGIQDGVETSDDEWAVEDDTVPGGVAKGEYVEVLPKTGGIPAMFIYLMGCMVLLAGIGVYKRAE